MEENITIEFVKEWIDKHNLTKDSFDRIMNDLIYNSGHNYIDNPSLRYWLIDNTYKFRDMLPVELNDNQQLLLEDIQDVASYHEDKNLLGLIWVVGQRIVNKSDIKRFSNDEIMQVLAAFAEWGMKNDQED